MASDSLLLSIPGPGDFNYHPTSDREARFSHIRREECRQLADVAHGHAHNSKRDHDAAKIGRASAVKALRELRREQKPESAFVFTTERGGGPMTRSNVAKLIDNAAKRAGLLHCHPHQLRHTCGHLLADAGHDTRRLWLGHSDIKHTARYSELSARPFRDFWR